IRHPIPDVLNLLLDPGAALGREGLQRNGCAGILWERYHGAGMVVQEDADSAVARLGAAEDARHGVIVLLRDRIELVIVATGTRYGQTLEGLERGVDLLVDHVHLELLAVALVMGLRAKGEEAGGDEELRLLLIVPGRQQVAGELFADELVVGLVGVEGSN